MKNKGFSLIELLAVIAILGIILLIIMPSITGIMNRTQNRLNDEQKEAILNAAKQWGISNLVYSDGKIYYNGVERDYVTIEELQNSGFLEDKVIKDMTDKGDVDVSTKVCVSYKDYQYVYEYDGESCNEE